MMIKNPGSVLVLLFFLISLAFISLIYEILCLAPINKIDHGTLVIIVFTLIFAYFVATPILMDIVGAYVFEYSRINAVLEDDLKNNKDSVGEISARAANLIAGFEETELTGVRNLTRAMIALGILLIIGVAIGFIILNMYRISYSLFIETNLIRNATIMKDLNDNMTLLSNILGNILSILAGAVAAITGFFFGSRNPEEPKRPRANEPPPNPKVTSGSPDSDEPK